MTREERQAARLYTMGSAWTFDEASVARKRLTAALDLLDEIERVMECGSGPCDVAREVWRCQEVRRLLGVVAARTAMEV